MIDKQNAEASKNQLIAAAFTAWQLGAGRGKNRPVNFGEYLRNMGLAEKEKPVTEEQKKEAYEKVNSIAERLKNAKRKRKG